MPPRKRARSSAPVTEVSTLWTNGGGYHVSSIAPDGSGNMFVSSMTCIHKISDGVETVVAGGDVAGHLDGPQGMFSGIVGLAVGADGCLIVSDRYCIRKVAVDGQVSSLAGDPGGEGDHVDGQGAEARFEFPGKVAVDLDGNVLVADYWNDCIRKVAPDGAVSTLAGSTERHGDGYADGPADEARFQGPQGVAVDLEGNVFIADTGNNCIRKISRDGAVSTLAGSTEGEGGHTDGAGDAARFFSPMALAVDIDGNIVVADTDSNCIRKVTPEGVVSTLAGPTSLTSPTGNVDGPANQARFFSPGDVAIDMDGNVLVADYHNNSVRMITHTGLSRGAALPRWPVVKPALAANLVALLDDERFADVSFGTHAPSAPTVAIGSYRNSPAPTLSGASCVCPA
jgi:hypothetical protein